MKNENENLGFTALMLEVGIVIVMCLIILARLQTGDGRKEVPSPTVTPTVMPTEEPTLFGTCGLKGLQQIRRNRMEKVQ